MTSLRDQKRQELKRTAQKQAQKDTKTLEMYNECQGDIERLNRKRFQSQVYEEDEDRKTIKNIFKMSRIQVDKSKNSAKKKVKKQSTLDKMNNDGIFENPDSVDAASPKDKDKPGKIQLYKENLSDQEYEYSSSSEESAEDIFD